MAKYGMATNGPTAQNHMWANKGLLLSHKNTYIGNSQMAQIENSGHKVEGPLMVAV